MSIKTNPACMALLEAWQINLGNDLVNIKARELEPEKLRGKTAEFAGQNAEWARECKRNGNFKSTSMANWILVSPNNPVLLVALLLLNCIFV